VTLNLPHNRLTAVLRVGYSCALIMSYPIQLFAAVDIIEKLKCYENIPTWSRLPNVRSINSS